MRVAQTVQCKQGGEIKKNLNTSETQHFLAQAGTALFIGTP